MMQASKRVRRHGAGKHQGTAELCMLQGAATAVCSKLLCGAGKPAVGPSAVPGAAAPPRKRARGLQPPAAPAPPAGAPQPAAGRAGGAPERTAAARQAGAQPQRPAGGANGVVQCGPGQGAELLGRRTPGGVVGAAAAAGAADGGPADGSAGGGGDSAADSPLALANGGAHEAEAGDEGASTVHMPGLLVRVRRTAAAGTRHAQCEAGCCSGMGAVWGWHAQCLDRPTPARYVSGRLKAALSLRERSEAATGMDKDKRK